MKEKGKRTLKLVKDGNQTNEPVALNQEERKPMANDEKKVGWPNINDVEQRSKMIKTQKYMKITKIM